MIIDADSLSAALANANDGDKLELASGELMGTFDIFKSVTLVGKGAATVLWHPTGPVLRIHNGNCHLEDLRMEITEGDNGQLVEGKQPRLRNVEMRAGTCGDSAPFLPPIIHIPEIPPGEVTFVRFHVQNSSALSLSLKSDIIRLDTSYLPPGNHIVRLQMLTEHLINGDVIMAQIIFRSDNCRYDIPVRAYVREGAKSLPPDIYVPLDAHTIMEAISMANPGSCVIVSSGEWRENIKINKPIILKSDCDDGVATIYSRYGPTVDILSKARIIGMHIVCESGPCMQIDAKYVVLEQISIEAHKGNGIIAQPGSISELNGVHISNCHAYGLVAERDSSLKLQNCQLHHNHKSNIKIMTGSEVEAKKTGFQKSISGSGVFLQGTLLMDNCKVVENAHAGVWVDNHGILSGSNCFFEKNGHCGVHALPHSHVKMRRTKLAEKIAVITEPESEVDII